MAIEIYATWHGMGQVVMDHGIVLRKNRFAESSLMLTCLTATQGKVKLAARSALRPTSPLRGRLDLGHTTRLVWSPSAQSEVHHLKEAEIVRVFSPCEPAHLTLMAAAYFSALTEAVTSPGEPCNRVYDLLERGLGYLSQNPPDQRAVAHFEKQLAHILGILDPQVTSAVSLLGHYLGKVPPMRAEMWPLLPVRSIAQPPGP